jgi:hypothetical protein
MFGMFGLEEEFRKAKIILIFLKVNIFLKIIIYHKLDTNTKNIYNCIRRKFF